MFNNIGDIAPGLRIARGLIINDRDEIVLTRRIAKAGLARTLELPGGKYKSGETFVDALRREVHEEVNVHVEPWGEQLVVESRILEKRPGSPYTGLIITTVSQASPDEPKGLQLRPQVDEVSEIICMYVPDLGSVAHELTLPTLRAIGVYGLLELANIPDKMLEVA